MSNDPRTALFDAVAAELTQRLGGTLLGLVAKAQAQEGPWLLSFPEAVKLSGISQGMIQAAVDAGKLDVYMVGSARRIHRQDLEVWVASLRRS